VLAGIVADLGAIQRHMAQAHQPRFLAESQYLNKEAGQSREMVPAEIADPAVVGQLVSGQHAEVSDFPAGFLDFAGAGQPYAVGVREQQHQHPRLIRILTPGIFLLVDGVDRLQIKISSKLQHEEHQVVLRQPATGEGGSSCVCYVFQGRKTWA